MELYEIIQGFLDPGQRFLRWQMDADKLCEETRQLNQAINACQDPGELEALVYALTGEPCPPELRLSLPVYVDFGKNLHLGSRVTIYPGCHFQDQGGITIGDDCCLGHRVTILTGSPEQSPGVPRVERYRPVHLGRNVFVGAGAAILPGVTIGDWAVIAAGAVVTGNIPGGAMAAGVPARVVRQLQPGTPPPPPVEEYRPPVPGMLKHAVDLLTGHECQWQPREGLQLLEQLPCPCREEGQDEIYRNLYQGVRFSCNPWVAQALCLLSRKLGPEYAAGPRDLFQWNFYARTFDIPGSWELFQELNRMYPRETPVGEESIAQVLDSAYQGSGIHLDTGVEDMAHRGDARCQFALGYMYHRCSHMIFHGYTYLTAAARQGYPQAAEPAREAQKKLTDLGLELWQ